MTTILIIEDEDNTRENIAEGLSYSGYQSIEAPNGQVGVELAKTHLPDLIICDINMPIMNGYEVLMALRHEHDTANIPFVFLTAQSDYDSMREGMNLGADDYIPKPFEYHELLRAIETRLQKQQTATKLYETQLQNLRHSIVQAIPHELRTPLMGIIGYGELLAMDNHSMTSEQIAGMASEIAKSGWRLHHVIENYLVYAQIELIANDPVRRRTLNRDRVQHPVAVIQAMANDVVMKYGLQILYNGDYSPSIAIDQENLSKIVYELVDNACKFSDPNAAITLSTRVQENLFVVTIENFGRGMTDEQIASVGAYMQFERTIYEQQGLGLGLIIAKRLIELHNGQLHIHSILNEKTIITMTFNLAD